MSIHSSLRSSGKGRKHRSVLKRYERLNVLKNKGLWDDTKTVLGLVKVKQQKLKVKKEKPEAAAAAGGAPAAGAAAPAGAAPKAAAGAKAAKPEGKSDKK
jgi:small basic protein (TIGR04137 family)